MSKDTTTPQKPPVKKDAVIIKAVHKLKIKTGPGGFDPRNITNARRRLEDAAHIFPAVASQDLTLIEEALHAIASGQDHAIIRQKIMAACAELKAHSAMFRFPLVTQVAESLLTFTMRLKQSTELAREVITEHLKALRIAIGEGPRAITPHDHETLLRDLEKAIEKVLRLQSA